MKKNTEIECIQQMKNHIINNEVGFETFFSTEKGVVTLKLFNELVSITYKSSIPIENEIGVKYALFGCITVIKYEFLNLPINELIIRIDMLIKYSAPFPLA